MDLCLYFMELPTGGALASLDRRLDKLSRVQEPVEHGRRLWITHLPETSSRPFLHAKPFDILVLPVCFSDSEIEDYRLGLGAEPKRRLICRGHEVIPAVVEVQFGLVSDIMASCASLLCLTPPLAARMLGADPMGDDMTISRLDSLPGSVFEVVHEDARGELHVEWYVDGTWLRAWMTARRRNAQQPPVTSRFASLDYG